MRGGSAAAVKIATRPPAPADRAMLRQVWINLVGNACKYSAKKSDPRVAIGGRTEDAENIYWVRDNRAGVDMRYAEKLFGGFPRPHRPAGITGTRVRAAVVH